MNAIKNNKNNKLRDRVYSHFEKIAPDYDLYKSRASYYYYQLRKLLMELLPDAEKISVLEIGCGTGQLLASLNPRRGLGIDISESMITIATSHWAGRDELSFRVGDAESVSLDGNWDAVIMADVLEHLYDAQEALLQLGSQLPSGAKLIATWANPVWGPILHLLEMLKMKMPEGPHQWEPIPIVLSYVRKAGFNVVTSGTRCLVPAKLPLADALNNGFYKVPILKKAGLIQYFTAVKN